jgi:hypothetical protein
MLCTCRGWRGRTPICQVFLDVFVAFAHMAANDWADDAKYLGRTPGRLYSTPIMLFVKQKAFNAAESEQFYRHIQFFMLFCCANPPKRLPASKSPGYSPGP